MKAFKRILPGVAVAAGLASLTMAPAHAALITFGGQTATDGSGLTSSWLGFPADNKPSTASGFFVETFDPATRNLDFPVGLTTSTSSITVGSGCSFNSFNALGVTTTGNGMGIRSGSTPTAAAPGGDTTCYGFTPKETGGVAGSVKVDYSNFQGTGATIDYVGFYYGSIDSYNSIKFYSSGNALIQGNGALSDGIIDGNEILQAFNLVGGNRANSNIYVNILFAPSEQFTAFEFISTQRAFELDNIVVHANRVPEPASLALVLAGLAALGMGGAVRRRASAV